MSFWSSEKLKRRVSKEKLVTPFSEVRVQHGAYELALGPEAFITSTEKKQKMEFGDQVAIPPGQFGLLLTEEAVAIPADAIGFISMRAKWKLDGLLNVSGFHVDPGFSGRLKFSVYNAGSRTIHLARGDRVFMIWFSDLDLKTTDVYKGIHIGQNEITSDDINRMHGEVASPGALKNKIDSLEAKHDRRLKELEEKLKTRKDIWLGVFIGFILLILTLVAERASEWIFPNKESGNHSVSQSTNSPVIRATAVTNSIKP